MPNYAAPQVIKIEILDGLKIKLFLANKIKIIDLNDGDVASFPKLNDANYFKKAKLQGGSIIWPDGFQLDLDELVYEFPEVKNSFSTKIAGHYKKI
jgi:hypothetical protein